MSNLRVFFVVLQNGKLSHFVFIIIFFKAFQNRLSHKKHREKAQLNLVKTMNLIHLDLLTWINEFFN
jgi:hypothetical protein